MGRAGKLLLVLSHKERDLLKQEMHELLQSFSMAIAKCNEQPQTQSQFDHVTKLTVKHRMLFNILARLSTLKG